MDFLRLFLLLALLLLLQHLLDDLLLLNEEGSDNAVTDTATASRTTVGALDGLLGLGDLGVLAGSESGNLRGQESVACFEVSERFAGGVKQADWSR